MSTSTIHRSSLLYSNAHVVCASLVPILDCVSADLEMPFANIGWKTCVVVHELQDEMRRADSSEQQVR